MDAYEDQTCISFQKRTNQEDYIRFFSGNGCVLSSPKTLCLRMIAVILVLYKPLWLHLLTVIAGAIHT